MPWVRCPQESARSPQQILLRLATFLLACVLLALHWGHSLSQEVADLCRFVGLNGLAFYFALELVADQRARKEQQDTKMSFVLGDQRLSHRLREEKRMATIVEMDLRQNR